MTKNEQNLKYYKYIQTNLFTHKSYIRLTTYVVIILLTRVNKSYQCNCTKCDCKVGKMSDTRSTPATNQYKKQYFDLCPVF